MATILPDELDAIGIQTVSGTANEVRKRLRASDEDQVVALTLEPGDRKATAVAEAIRLIAPLVLRTLANREQAKLAKIVDALVPDVAPPEHLMIEARMAGEARAAVIETADWLTAAQLSEVAGFGGLNPSAQPNRWKREGRIFAIRQAGSDLFPGYALNPEAGYRPIPGLAPILSLFEPEMDEWEIAIWFASVNSYLGGTMPKDLLLREPGRVLAAAEDEMAGVLHG